MPLSWWELAFELLGLGLQICILALLVRYRLVRRWPSIFTMVALDVAGNMPLLWFSFHPHHYPQYFYTYWLSSGVQSLLRIWIAIDIIRSFESADYLPAWVYWAGGLLSSLAALAAGFWNWHGNIFSYRLAAPVLRLNSSIEIAWACFFVVLLAAIRLTGVGWPHLSMRFANGIVWQICSGLLCAQLISQRTHALVLVGGALQSLFEIAILVFWIASIRHRTHLSKVGPR